MIKLRYSSILKSMERKMVRDVVEHGQTDESATARVSKNSFLSRERREERRGKLLDESVLEKNTRGKQIIEGGRFSWWYAILAIVAIFALVFVWLTLSAEAKVLVNPRTKVVELDTTLKAYKSPDTPLLLGFSVKEMTDEKSVELKSTGTKYVEKKAIGKLSVYNEYSKEPVKIISNTRFVSETGKVFRTYSSFYIPGPRMVGTKVEPGRVEISVTADQPGSEYNVPAGDFSLPGLANSPMFKSVYAKSVSAMSGGKKGEAPMIADTDLEDAKVLLEAELTKSLVSKVSDSLGEQEMLPEGAHTINFSFNEDVASSSDETAKTVLRAKGIIQAVIFEKDAISKNVARRELSGLSDESVLIANWPELDVELASHSNLATSVELSIRILGNAKFVWQINKSALADDLAGVLSDEYSKVFAEYPIESAEVDIKPFWRSKFPKDPGDIIIEITPSKG